MKALNEVNTDRLNKGRRIRSTGSTGAAWPRWRNNSQPPVLVYASSVAVYGGDLPERMNEAAELHPELSYGTHKAMVESAVSDLARRGDVDGRVLRLPGIVARPREPNGLRSAFMSDLMRAFA